MDRDAYLRSWSQLHGQYDPRQHRLAWAWLGGWYPLARALAAIGVPPNLLTLSGVGAAGAAVALAGLGAIGPLLAGIAVVFCAALDTLDGAVAVLSGRVGRFGAVLDSVADRVSEALFFAALWVLGAPATACLFAGLLTFLHEYVRARVAAVGMTEIGAVTVWERPVRLLLFGASFVATSVLAGTAAPVLGSWLAGALALAGVIHLLIVVRRQLASDG